LEQDFLGLSLYPLMMDEKNQFFFFTAEIFSFHFEFLLPTFTNFTGKAMEKVDWLENY
jgi:hypothetical protein